MEMKLFEILTFSDGWSLWSNQEGQPYLRPPDRTSFVLVERNAEDVNEQAHRAGWYEELDCWIDAHCAEETAPLKAALLALVRWRYHLNHLNHPPAPGW